MRCHYAMNSLKENDEINQHYINVNHITHYFEYSIIKEKEYFKKKITV